MKITKTRKSKRHKAQKPVKNRQSQKIFLPLTPNYHYALSTAEKKLKKTSNKCRSGADNKCKQQVKIIKKEFNMFLIGDSFGSSDSKVTVNGVYTEVNSQTVAANQTQNDELSTYLLKDSQDGQDLITKFETKFKIALLTAEGVAQLLKSFVVNAPSTQFDRDQTKKDAIQKAQAECSKSGKVLDETTLYRNGEMHLVYWPNSSENTFFAEYTGTCVAKE